MSLKHVDGEFVDPEDYVSRVNYCKKCDAFPKGEDTGFGADGNALIHLECGETLFGMPDGDSETLFRLSELKIENEPNDLGMVVDCLDVLAERIAKIEAFILRLGGGEVLK